MLTITIGRQTRTIKVKAPKAPKAPKLKLVHTYTEGPHAGVTVWHFTDGTTKILPALAAQPKAKAPSPYVRHMLVA